jgi:hypothetical protein
VVRRSRAANTAVAVGTTFEFDVTDDLRRFLGSEWFGRQPSWIVRPTDVTARAEFKTRESGAASAPRLVISTAARTDFDRAKGVALTAAVDSSVQELAGELPSLDGTTTRPLAAVALGPQGRAVSFVRDELLVMTDDATYLAAVKQRWNATEVFSPSMKLPVVPTLHVLMSICRAHYRGHSVTVPTGESMKPADATRGVSAEREMLRFVRCRTPVGCYPQSVGGTGTFDWTAASVPDCTTTPGILTALATDTRDAQESATIDVALSGKCDPK